MSKLKLVSQVPTENAIKNSIIDFLVLRGALVLRVNSGAAMGQYQDKQGHIKERFTRFVQWYASGVLPKEGWAGVSDILAVMDDGKFLSLECKRPGGKESEAQKRFLNEVRKRGGIAGVVTSVDDLIKLLQEAQ